MRKGIFATRFGWLNDLTPAIFITSDQFNITINITT